MSMPIEYPVPFTAETRAAAELKALREELVGVKNRLAQAVADEKDRWAADVKAIEAEIAVREGKPVSATK